MKTWYTLRGDDCIAAVGGDWNDFASQNQGNLVFSENVVGRSVWDFIHGDDESAMFRSILFTCRYTGDTLELMSDCSSSGIERLMHMKVVPLTEQGVRIEHKLVEDSLQAVRTSH